MFVFFGRARFVQVDSDRFGSHARAFYDRGWIRQPFRVTHPPSDKLHPRPRYLDEILSAAEKLGAGFDFVRVDFYDLPDGPKFGEMTFSPGGDLEGFEPDGHDVAWGLLWEGQLEAASPAS